MGENLNKEELNLEQGTTPEWSTLEEVEMQPDQTPTPPTPNDEEKNPDAILRNAGPDIDPQPVGELTDMPAEETNYNPDLGTDTGTESNEPSQSENESTANTDEYDNGITSPQSTNTGEVA